MSDKTLKILLGIIAVNLTLQTVKDVGLFPTAYAQDDIQRVVICERNPANLTRGNAHCGNRVAICNPSNADEFTNCAAVLRKVDFPDSRPGFLDVSSNPN